MIKSRGGARPQRPAMRRRRPGPAGIYDIRGRAARGAAPPSLGWPSRSDVAPASRPGPARPSSGTDFSVPAIGGDGACEGGAVSAHGPGIRDPLGAAAAGPVRGGRRGASTSKQRRRGPPTAARRPGSAAAGGRGACDVSVAAAAEAEHWATEPADDAHCVGGLRRRQQRLT